MGKRKPAYVQRSRQIDQYEPFPHLWMTATSASEVVLTETDRRPMVVCDRPPHLFVLSYGTAAMGNTVAGTMHENAHVHPVFHPWAIVVGIALIMPSYKMLKRDSRLTDPQEAQSGPQLDAVRITGNTEPS